MFSGTRLKGAVMAVNNQDMEQNKQIKSPFSDKELEHFKNLILKKKANSEDQLERMKKRMESAQEDLSESSAYSLHMADVGTDAMEREKLQLMISREQKYLGYLERALERIENQTYGICKVTGKAISKERLEAVPHTEISIEAKLKQQKS
jgi:DnaK suppressor protein